MAPTLIVLVSRESAFNAIFNGGLGEALPCSQQKLQPDQYITYSYRHVRGSHIINLHVDRPSETSARHSFALCVLLVNNVLAIPSTTTTTIVATNHTTKFQSSYIYLLTLCVSRVKCCLSTLEQSTEFNVRVTC